MKVRILKFFNVKFFDVDYNYVTKFIMKKGGYLVFPAASALTNIRKNHRYRKALQKSTAALCDSGYFSILLFIFKLVSLKKFSGYKFISFFLDDNFFKKKKILLLNPSMESTKINRSFFKSRKFKFIKNYTCPIYNAKNVIDQNLLNLINYYNPEIIISNIGGLIQEELAFYITKNYKNKIVILCTGAALSFFTGEQAKIGPLFDRLYLGWFKRLIFNPVDYYKRVLVSFGLASLVVKNKINISYN
jgi:UDP-N-acetyl-D-mannosaminuronic acid transferase (WecB/TagA/CpsF family)